MQVQNTNNICFNGGYRLSRLSAGTKQTLKNEMPDVAKIMEGIINISDMFILTEHKYDKTILDILNKHSLNNYIFYPQLTSKYSDSLSIKKFIGNAKLPPCRRFMVSYSEKYDALNVIKNTKQMLKENFGIEISEPVIQRKHGAIVLVDDSSNIKVSISPERDYKRYMKIIRTTNDAPNEFYEISDFGSKEPIIKKYSKPNELMEFSQLFNNSLIEYDESIFGDNETAKNNFELLLSNIILDGRYKDLAKHATTEVPELTLKLCSDNNFIPTVTILRLIESADKETQSIAYEIAKTNTYYPTQLAFENGARAMYQFNKR